MQVTIKGTQIGLTPSIKAYIDEKVGSLGKLLTSFEKDAVVEVSVEIARTTRHHHKGDVFRAEANLSLPGKMLRAEKIATDMHTAIDRMQGTLRLEITKYKATHLMRRILRRNH